MEKPYSTEIENIEDLDKYLGKEIGISKCCLLYTSDAADDP